MEKSFDQKLFFWDGLVRGIVLIVLVFVHIFGLFHFSDTWIIIFILGIFTAGITFGYSFVQKVYDFYLLKENQEMYIYDFSFKPEGGNYIPVTIRIDGRKSRFYIIFLHKDYLQSGTTSGEGKYIKENGKLLRIK